MDTRARTGLREGFCSLACHFCLIDTFDPTTLARKWWISTSLCGPRLSPKSIRDRLSSSSRLRRIFFSCFISLRVSLWRFERSGNVYHSNCVIFHRVEARMFRECASSWITISAFFNIIVIVILAFIWEVWLFYVFFFFCQKAHNCESCSRFFCRTWNDARQRSSIDREWRFCAFTHHSTRIYIASADRRV